MKVAEAKGRLRGKQPELNRRQAARLQGLGGEIPAFVSPVGRSG